MSLIFVDSPQSVLHREVLVYLMTFVVSGRRVGVRGIGKNGSQLASLQRIY
jgi:hypothetical protein